MRILSKITVVGVLICGGCGAPTWGFRGVEGQRIAVDGSEFVVRIKGERAEAVRVTPHLKPHIGVIFERASRAMTQVSGCPVRAGSLRGDPAVVTARLTCG